jgi:hypothetical protein
MLLVTVRGWLGIRRGSGYKEGQGHRLNASGSEKRGGGNRSFRERADWHDWWVVSVGFPVITVCILVVYMSQDICILVVYMSQDMCRAHRVISIYSHRTTVIYL